MKVGKSSKNASMFCILFTDKLLICEEKRKNKEVTFSVKEKLLLDNSMEVLPAEESKSPYCFKLKGTSTMKKFVASSDNDKIQWSSTLMNAIKEIVETTNLNRKRGSTCPNLQIVFD